MYWDFFLLKLNLFLFFIGIAVINGFSVKRSSPSSNSDGLSPLSNPSGLGLSIMTGGMYNPLDPNSFMSGGVNNFVAGDGKYVPNYDPNKYAFMYAGKTKMNFGNGGCCGVDGTYAQLPDTLSANSRHGAGFGRNGASSSESNTARQSGTDDDQTSNFGITAMKINAINTQKSTGNSWKGEWVGGNGNSGSMYANTASLGNSKKQWNGDWNSGWPGIKSDKHHANQESGGTSHKQPGWAGDWSSHFTGNKPDTANNNTNSEKSHKQPDWAGDWSTKFSVSGNHENGKDSSKSKIATDWNGNWQKSWPGIPGSFGSINAKTLPETSTKTANVVDTSAIDENKTFEKTEKVLQEIINAVKGFDVTK